MVLSADLLMLPACWLDARLLMLAGWLLADAGWLAACWLDGAGHWLVDA